ncbi:hypothetical protein Poli38472_007150 [Pythium oligandrum]|uniref:Uncharacterized protein n=1 Tax=Pythium oligandrum TaxID=41045 RepID=A0A8K1C9K0_PYTOL|nr:hypothetical protein Poli38472_007150 [Pythium oligandrum]|eukprot:TMW59005.1 hypothetical protein Poli38472_007150 [Pythium oligandrum]
MALSSVVLGTATIFLRPLRYLFDIGTAVTILSEHDASSDAKTPVTPLGSVHVHVSIAHNACRIRQGADHEHVEAKSDEPTELRHLLGQFVCVRVRMQPPKDSVLATRDLRVQYQLSPATESFVFPVDHTNAFHVLVTDELLAHIDSTALVFQFIPLAALQGTEHDAKTTTQPPIVETKEAIPVPMYPMRTEETEAALRATSNAATAAETAASAAKEAAMAANAAMEAAKATTEREVERVRVHTREQQDETEKRRALELSALAKDHEMASLRYAQELQQLSDAKQQLETDRERLEAALLESKETLDKWKEQTTQTDHALELLQQRMAGDARERDELQKRLRVLEEEKLELLKKHSRVCVLQ